MLFDGLQVVSKALRNGVCCMVAGGSRRPVSASALARRAGQAPAETVLKFDDLEVDLLTRKALRAGHDIVLQPKEFALLEYLIRHAGQVVTRTMLLEHVWGYHFDPQTNVIDVHISRLRQKIDRGFQVPLLHTVRGAGYCLRAAA